MITSEEYPKLHLVF